jgi:hypothetical protein
VFLQHLRVPNVLLQHAFIVGNDVHQLLNSPRQVFVTCGKHEGIKLVGINEAITINQPINFFAYTDGGEGGLRRGCSSTPSSGWPKTASGPQPQHRLRSYSHPRTIRSRPVRGA